MLPGAGTLESRQVLVYFGAVATGLAAGLLSPALAGVMAPLVAPALALLMYIMFTQLPLARPGGGAGNPRFLAALLLANFVFVPLLVWGLVAAFPPHPAVLAGVLLVLLAPCIDYVVVFTHLGHGDAALLLGATPLLLVLQFLLLPLYLALLAGGHGMPEVTFRPFIEAFLLFILLPLVLAWLTQRLWRTGTGPGAWQKACAWLPVPAMAAVLLLVAGSRIGGVVEAGDSLARVLPVYAAFALLAPLAGMLAARLLALPAPAARAVAFSAGTRNSLVVQPLALALPGEAGRLAAMAVVTQTLVELLAELGYLRGIPALIRGR